MQDAKVEHMTQRLTVRQSKHSKLQPAIIWFKYPPPFVSYIFGTIASLLGTIYSNMLSDEEGEGIGVNLAGTTKPAN